MKGHLSSKAMLTKASSLLEDEDEDEDDEDDCFSDITPFFLN